jgi:hypothetical protein
MGGKTEEGRTPTLMADSLLPAGSSAPVVANLQYAYDPAYAAALEEAARTKRCIFCDPTFQADPQKVLLRHEGWYVRLSDYPPDDTKGGKPEITLLLIPEHHDDGLTVKDWLVVGQLEQWAVTHFKLEGKGWGLAIRRGHPLWCGRTILHPHFQLIVPRIVEGPDAQRPQVAAWVPFAIG